MTTSTYTLAPSDSISYETGYKIFLKPSDFREKIIEKFSSLVMGRVNTYPHMRVLDFGCGNGEMTVQYLEALKAKSNDLDLCLVEPAVQSLKEAFQLMKSSAVVRCKDSLPKGEMFDFIIASYVFYHLSAECLNELAYALNPSGVLTIMMGTSENPFKSHPGLKRETAHGSSDQLNPFLNKLERTGDFKIERCRVNTNLNLQGLQTDGSLTDEAKELLGFSLNQNYSSLTNIALKAVNEIYKHAFEENNCKVTSVHEIIWIKRLK